MSAPAALYSTMVHRRLQQSGHVTLTDRAWCRNAAALPPEGRMKFLSGGSSRSISSIHACTHARAAEDAWLLCAGVTTRKY